MISSHSQTDATGRSVNKLIFVEDMDILVAASEDSNVYVWAFDDQAMHELKDSIPVGDKMFHKMGDETVTNRVAGLTCRQVLNKHTQSVTGLALVSQQKQLSTSYLLSCGADRKLCMWDLKRGSLVGTYVNSAGCEIASEEAITDIAYANGRQEFAYSSADKLIYIRKFCIQPSNWRLLHVLQGHESEVSHIIWNSVSHAWVSGSDDCTLRTWTLEQGDYLRIVTSVVDTQCPITALTCDVLNGAVIVGLQDVIRVYESGTMKRLSTHTGHRDSVRGLMHVPERSQYISISWDGSICIWNSYNPTTG